MNNVIKKSNEITDELTIAKKVLDLIYYTNDVIRKYPKSEKFVLATETKNVTNKILKGILIAQKSTSKLERLKILKGVDISLCFLKINVRLAYRYKYISEKNYTTWSEKITDICNMLGSWILSCQKK